MGSEPAASRIGGIQAGSPAAAAGAGAPTDWLVGGGDLGELIRSTDWSRSPFGARDRWPESLRTAVNIVVASRTAMCLLWGPELRLLYNDAYRDLAADKHPSALGRPMREVWSEIWPELAPVFAAVTERGESFVFEDRPFRLLRRGSAEDTVFTLSYTPVRLESGAVGGVLTLLQETTAAEERRRLISESEARLRSLIDMAPYGAHLYELDPTDRLVFVGYNKSADSILGVDHTQFLGKTITEAFAPLAATEIPERYAEVARTGEPWETEKVDYEHGEIRGGFEVRAVQTGPRRMAAFFRDITERKKAEQELRLLSEIAANVAEGVFLVSVTTLEILYANRTMEQMFGYAPGELAGQHVSILNAPGGGGPVQTASQIESALREHGQYRGDVLTVKKDGTPFWTRTTISTMQHPRYGQVYVSLQADITERKRAEEALREADRRKTEFLAMLSHELRNPLTPICNSLYVLGRTPPGNEQARRAQAIINRQVAHLSRLVDELLDVTRITRGRIELRRERLNFNELAQRTVEDHRDVFSFNGLELTVNVAPVELWVDGDRTRLAQAMGNLLQNAAKFTPPGGSVAVSLGPDPSRTEAVLSVRDTGAGIPPEMMPRLFEPFAQADRTLDRSKGGLGLGLALVRGLVEMHGGSVSARSRGIGQGSEFTIRLPLQAPTAAHDEEQLGVRRADPSRRVLVIEDNTDAADSLREVLELDGHVVVVAHDGRVGIERARALRPEVVLCDIGLPGMDGYAVARALRADPELGHATLVALTGYAGPEDVANAKEAGFDAHIPKPPNIDALAKIVASSATDRK